MKTLLGLKWIFVYLEHVDIDDTKVYILSSGLYMVMFSSLGVVLLQFSVGNFMILVFYPDVRMMISIGGDMETDCSFNPDVKHVWVATAVNSIKEIIHIYDDDNNKKNCLIILIFTKMLPNQVLKTSPTVWDK